MAAVCLPEGAQLRGLFWALPAIFERSFLKSLQTTQKKEPVWDLIKVTLDAVGKMLKVLGQLWHVDPNFQRCRAEAAPTKISPPRNKHRYLGDQLGKHLIPSANPAARAPCRKLRAL